MKITYNWLKEYINLNLSPEKLCNKFNSIGLSIANFTKVLGSDDFCYDLEILPNRSDCLSVIGIARVLSAILNKPLKLPIFAIKEDKETKIDECIKVQVKNPNLCPRYSARVVSNVKIKESPVWMKVRLESVGIRPVNNVVDVTNYILMETGHPLHSFDYDLITGKTIIVRNANGNEEIITLDGISRKLKKDMLVISDKKRVVALAGIMGGKETEINSNTSNVLLECAYFNPVNIRKTSKMLNLSSESSYRFERGVDYEGLIYSINRASYLIQKLAGGNVVKDYVDLYPKRINPVKIKTRFTRVNKILGSNIKKHKMISSCKRLGFTVLKKTSNHFVVKVPSFRTEMDKEIDIIEEIAQIYTYDKIKESIPKIKIKVFPQKLNNKLEDLIKKDLVSKGLYESINFSFMSKNWFDKIGLSKENPSVCGLIGITNPLNENWNTLRTTLLPGLLDNVTLNVCSRGNKNVKIFEIGKVFFQKESFLEEFKSLGIVMTGSIYEKGWLQKDESVSFYHLKGVIEDLFKNLGMEFKILNETNEIFNSDCSTSIVVKDEKIGICGKISKNIIEALDMKCNVYYSEIKLPLIERYVNFSKTYSVLAKFPGIRRDISFIINNNISAQKISDYLESFKNGIVEKIDLVDVYEGEQIGDGKKSLTYSIIYRSLDRTLTDKEVNSINDKLIDSVSNTFNTQIRS